MRCPSLKLAAEGKSHIVRKERIRHHGHDVRESEAARREEHYRVKNEHACATQQLVQRDRGSMFGASCCVCDRLHHVTYHRNLQSRTKHYYRDVAQADRLHHVL